MSARNVTHTLAPTVERFLQTSVTDFNRNRITDFIILLFGFYRFEDKYNIKMNNFHLLWIFSTNYNRNWI